MSIKSEVKADWRANSSEALMSYFNPLFSNALFH